MTSTCTRVVLRKSAAKPEFKVPARYSPSKIEKILFNLRQDEQQQILKLCILQVLIQISPNFMLDYNQAWYSL